jgi:xylan 1,4-beta-xylosidase
MHHTDSLGFWAFTDIFEEKGLGDTIFHGGFGLINAQGIPKPAYHGYWYLGQLGPRMLDMGDSHAVTRSEDAWQVLVWNYCHYNEKFAKGDPSDLKPLDRYGIFEEQGPERFEITLEGLSGRFRVLTYELDRERGSAFDAWVANGAPANPTPEEVAILKQLARPKAGIAYVEADGALTLSREVAPHGVVLFKVSPA